jgi:UPF0755 protein
MDNEFENTHIDEEKDFEHTKSFENNGVNQHDHHRKENKRANSGGSPLIGTLRSIVITLIGILLATIIVLVTFFSLKRNYYDPVDKDDFSSVRVEIPMGTSLSRISDILYEKQVIRNTAVFKVYVDFNDMASKLKAGTYDFSRAMSMDDIVNILGTGTSNIDVMNFTATEGMSVEDIANMFLEQEVLQDKDKFIEICRTGVGIEMPNFSVTSDEVDMSVIGEDKEGTRYVLEGYLFPDTYEIFVGSAPETLINKMLKRFEEIYTDDFLDRTQELDMTIGDVITLASIIEREGKPQDFKKISAVFHNRLIKEDKLMSCATVQYVIGIKKFQFTQAELDIVSPYNTYYVGGLPLAPISNPGKLAIEAALYPDEEYLDKGYYFFCSKDPESGELAFAVTYEDHEKNVEEYKHLWQAYDEGIR